MAGKILIDPLFGYAVLDDTWNGNSCCTRLIGIIVVEIQYSAWRLYEQC